MLTTWYCQVVVSMAAGCHSCVTATPAARPPRRLAMGGGLVVKPTIGRIVIVQPMQALKAARRT